MSLLSSLDPRSTPLSAIVDALRRPVAPTVEPLGVVEQILDIIRKNPTLTPTAGAEVDYKTCRLAVSILAAKVDEILQSLPPDQFDITVYQSLNLVANNKERSRLIALLLQSEKIGDFAAAYFIRIQEREVTDSAFCILPDTGLKRVARKVKTWIFGTEQTSPFDQPSDVVVNSLAFACGSIKSPLAQITGEHISHAKLSQIFDFEPRKRKGFVEFLDGLTRAYLKVGENAFDPRSILNTCIENPYISGLIAKELVALRARTWGYERGYFDSLLRNGAVSTTSLAEILLQCPANVLDSILINYGTKYLALKGVNIFLTAIVAAQLAHSGNKDSLDLTRKQLSPDASDKSMLHGAPFIAAILFVCELRRDDFRFRQKQFDFSTILNFMKSSNARFDWHEAENTYRELVNSRKQGSMNVRAFRVVLMDLVPPVRLIAQRPSEIKSEGNVFRGHQNDFFEFLLSERGRDAATLKKCFGAIQGILDSTPDQRRLDRTGELERAYQTLRHVTQIPAAFDSE